MKSIGIFEDEPVLQMMWEDIAVDAGFEITGVCSTVNECCGLADDGQMDVAVLDVELGGENSLNILRKLEQRNIPVLVCTGHELAALPDEFIKHVVLTKPFVAIRAIRQINELCNTGLAA